MNVGIIAARGSATRFGGNPKELMPIDKNKVSIDTQLTAMTLAGCRDIYVVATPQKAHYFAQRFSQPIYADMGIYPRIVTPFIEEDQYGPDLWNTLAWALEHLRSYNGFTCIGLADTVIPPTAFSDATSYFGEEGVQLGTFETNQPERFSVVVDNRIITKKEEQSKPQQAWGTITLAPPVSQYLAGKYFRHYDRALEQAIGVYSVRTYPLKFYYDVGSFEYYKNYLLGG